MDYAASWRNTGPFGIVVACGCALALAFGIAASNAVAISAGLAGLGWLALIGRRLLLRIDDESIESRGWVSRSGARWDEIHSITNSAHLSWPRDRWFGPLTFEVSASSGRFRVNFLYFGPEAFRAFRTAIKQHQISTSLRSDAARLTASLNPRMKSTFRAPSAWVALYWFLTGCFLLATVLNLLRVRGGFLTSHLADLTLPAWLYVLARQKAPGKRLGFPGMLGWLGKTPERAAVVLFLASATTEISQLFWPSGPFAGRFDPLDVAAFAIGLGAVYLADRRSSASGTALPPGS